jgi:bifunctional non-homologous end joining protein LigD
LPGNESADASLGRSDVADAGTETVFQFELVIEPKWDGWRTLCFVREGKAQFVSRRRNSLSERFPELREIGNLIKAETAVIDGEIVAIDKDGMPQFDGLRSRKHGECSTVFYAFDLLYLDGFNVTQCPLVKRKQLLRKILPKDNTGRVRFTEHISGSGERLFENSKSCNSKVWS